MPIDVSALTDYSWSDIAKAAKTAMITAALGGGQLTINGRQISRISIKEATDLYNLAVQAQTDEAFPEGGGLGLIGYGERV